MREQQVGKQPVWGHRDQVLPPEAGNPELISHPSPASLSPAGTEAGDSRGPGNWGDWFPGGRSLGAHLPPLGALPRPGSHSFACRRLYLRVKVHWSQSRPLLISSGSRPLWRESSPGGKAGETVMPRSLEIWRPGSWPGHLLLPSPGLGSDSQSWGLRATSVQLEPRDNDWSKVTQLVSDRWDSLEQGRRHRERRLRGTRALPPLGLSQQTRGQ